MERDVQTDSSESELNASELGTKEQWVCFPSTFGVVRIPISLNSENCTNCHQDVLPSPHLKQIIVFCHINFILSSLYNDCFTFSWDRVYKDELNNFCSHGDVGEIWFGEESILRIVRYVEALVSYVKKKQTHVIGHEHGLSFCSLKLDR